MCLCMAISWCASVSAQQLSHAINQARSRDWPTASWPVLRTARTRPIPVRRRFVSKRDLYLRCSRCPRARLIRVQATYVKTLCLYSWPAMTICGRLVVVGRKGDRHVRRQGRVIPYGPGSRRCSCKAKWCSGVKRSRPRMPAANARTSSGCRPSAEHSPRGRCAFQPANRRWRCTRWT